MDISLDSIKRLDQKDQENKGYLDSISKAMLDSLYKGQIRSVLVKTPGSNSFAMELNNAAWNFYVLGAKNPNHLAKAMLWSKRSIELNPASANYDTLAHILYRLGFLVEAESTQQTAIELAKSEKRDYKQMKEELSKIKEKTL